MATTPPRRDQPDPSTPNSDKKRLDGLWHDGQWWCNCQPRKPAVLREVKKDTPNKGKFFWTCAEYPFCGFFLWRDKAKARQFVTSSPLDESVELPPPPKTPTLTQSRLTAFGVQVTPGRRLSGSGVDGLAAAPLIGGEEDPASSSSATLTRSSDAARPEMQTPGPTASKRKRDAFAGENDEFSDMDSDEERQLVALAEKSAPQPPTAATSAAAPTTPVTPTANRSLDMVAGLPTPSVSRTLFPGGEQQKRQKTVSFEDPPPSELPTPAVTPVANRTQITPSSSPNDAGPDVADEVAEILRGQGLDAVVLQSVQRVLATSARKTKGIALGRDTARTALREKDERIAKLQDRIRALENKEKFLNSQVTNMKANLMKMYQDI